MNKDPQYWFEVGKTDRESGNTTPAVTAEDFFREIPDPIVALACVDAYYKGFRS